MSDFYKLDSIVKQMISSRKVNPSAYERYSSLLISPTNKSVIDYTMKAILSTFLPNPIPSEEILFPDVDSVSSFFLNVCQEYPWIIELELKHTDADKRYRMALILRSMFSLKRHLPALDVCRELLKVENIGIWETFLELFNDCEPQIRIVCVQTTELLLQTQIDEQIITNIVSNLNKRLRDLVDIIRCNSALVVENSCQSENILDNNLMRNLIARVGDSSLDVRNEVLICVSNVFQAIRAKYRKTKQHFFYKLPTACLLRYSTTDIEREKALIEEIFSDTLIDSSADSAVRIENLLNLVCFCDDIGVKSISKLFHSQLKLRQLFAKLIVSTQRHDYKMSIINANNKVYESLVKAFQFIDNIDEVLKKFHLLLKDYESVDDLRRVFECNPGLSCRQSMATIEEFFSIKQSIVDNRALKELKTALTVRLGIDLIDSKALIELLQHMNAIDCVFATRLASFVILLSKCYSSYLDDESVVQQLLGLPQIIIAFIAKDSMLPYMQCSDSLKDKIKHLLEYQSI